MFQNKLQQLIMGILNFSTNHSLYRLLCFINTDFAYAPLLNNKNRCYSHKAGKIMQLLKKINVLFFIKTKGEKI